MESYVSLPVLNINDIDDVNRRENILSNFLKMFKRNPEFIVRVPGRVNIIGEHIDYCGFGVLPMAIEQGILCAVGLNKNCSRVTICNENSQQFQRYELDDLIRFTIEFDKKPNWYDYILCGFKGIFETVGLDVTKKFPYGLNILVSSSIPMAAGLSSSSALVCTSAIILDYVLKLNLGKEMLAELCAKAERYIGTQGGGMDQAVILLAERNFAKSIEFNPLRSQNVQLPEMYSFLIIDSAVRINKAATADFNSRVVECRLATMVLCKKLGLDCNDCKNLADIVIKQRFRFEEIVGLVHELLHDGIYERNEICEILGIGIDEFTNKLMSKNTRNLSQFKLKQRALHVYEEANRVKQFRTICLSKESLETEKLGQLINESHFSLANLYECSHEVIEKIVEFVRPLVDGVRITGAGWGGCLIVMLRKEKVVDFLQKFRNEFNEEYKLYVTKPESGASIFVL